MYIMIENVGEAPVEAFQIMGISTTRGEDGTIGMFGSGTKYAICCLLRHGYEVIIYSGLRKLEFTIEDLTVDDGLKACTFNQVVCKVDGKSEKLNIVLQHGEMDWKAPHMAFREFIANALDRTWRQRKDYNIDWCPTHSVEGVEGRTRVFITRKPELDDYLDRINERFLHFSHQHNQKILVKKELSTVKFYRAGVFIGSGEKLSAFDYNLPDFQLTESRVLNPTGVGDTVSREFHSPYMTEELLKLITDRRETYETTLWPHFFKRWPLIKDIWWEKYGSAAVPYHSVDDLMMLDRDKSRKPVWVQEQWVRILGSNGIKVPTDVHKETYKREKRETRSELLDRIHVMAKSFSDLAKPKVAIIDGDDASVEDGIILMPRNLIGSNKFDETIIQMAASYYFRFSESIFYTKMLMRFLCPTGDEE